MKQLLTLILIVSAQYTFADTPGKAKMHPCKVTLQNLEKFTNYTFYYTRQYAGDSVFTLKESSIIIPPSGGAPDQIGFWGTNTVTKQNTDTITVDNYYAPDYVFIINKIQNDSIYYTKKELSNANEILSEGNTDDIANKELIADAKKAKQNHYIKIGGFVALGAAALGGIIWFLKRRKKQTV
jgi:hypothetical protein